MKESIFARAIAQPILFPDEMEIRFIPVDHFGNPTEEYFYGFGPETWTQVKNHYSIDEEYAQECEKHFRAGRAAVIAKAQDWPGRWPEPGDRDFNASFMAECVAEIERIIYSSGGLTYLLTLHSASGTAPVGRRAYAGDKELREDLNQLNVSESQQDRIFSVLHGPTGHETVPVRISDEVSRAFCRPQNKTESE